MPDASQLEQPMHHVFVDCENVRDIDLRLSGFDRVSVT